MSPSPRIPGHRLLHSPGPTRLPDEVLHAMSRQPVDLADARLDATIAECDPTWHLARLLVKTAEGEAAMSLWARDPGLALGRRVRVRVLARDVSLARAPQTGTSIGNQLAGVVEQIADDEHPALALVRVRVGQGSATVPVVARLTRRSAHALGLVPGLPVWAQVKTVALLE